MTDQKQKEINQKLLKVAANQQKIIAKLAQALQSMPSPDHPNLDEADTILAALPPNVKPAVNRLEVHNNEVRVKFNPGKGSDLAFAAVQKTVQNLQNANKLPSNSYTVREVV